MAFDRIVKLLGIITFGLLVAGCGLDGVRGTLISADNNRYVIRDVRGKEWSVRVDESTRRDPVQAGDEVRIYVRNDGHAAFVQKLQR